MQRTCNIISIPLFPPAFLNLTVWANINRLKIYHLFRSIILAYTLPTLRRGSHTRCINARCRKLDVVFVEQFVFSNVFVMYFGGSVGRHGFNNGQESWGELVMRSKQLNDFDLTIRSPDVAAKGGLLANDLETSGGSNDGLHPSDWCVPLPFSDK